MNKEEIKETKMPPTILSVLCLYFVVFIAGTIIVIQELFSKNGFWKGSGLFYYLMYIGMLTAAVLIIAVFSRCKAGWTIGIAIAISLIISGCILFLITEVHAILIIPFYCVFSILHLLPTSSREYFKTRGFPNKNSNLICIFIGTIAVFIIVSTIVKSYIH